MNGSTPKQTLEWAEIQTWLEIGLLYQTNEMISCFPISADVPDISGLNVDRVGARGRGVLGSAGPL